jgi:hypothetical protein
MYSKLVSQDVWHNVKGISSVQSPCPERTSEHIKIMEYFDIRLRNRNPTTYLTIFLGSVIGLT